MTVLLGNVSVENDLVIVCVSDRRFSVGSWLHCAAWLLLAKMNGVGFRESWVAMETTAKRDAEMERCVLFAEMDKYFCWTA